MFSTICFQIFLFIKAAGSDMTVVGFSLKRASIRTRIRIRIRFRKPAMQPQPEIVHKVNTPQGRHIQILPAPSLNSFCILNFPFNLFSTLLPPPQHCPSSPLSSTPPPSPAPSSPPSSPPLPSPTPSKPPSPSPPSSPNLNASTTSPAPSRTSPARH